MKPSIYTLCFLIFGAVFYSIFYFLPGVAAQSACGEDAYRACLEEKTSEVNACGQRCPQKEKPCLPGDPPGATCYGYDESCLNACSSAAEQECRNKTTCPPDTSILSPPPSSEETFVEYIDEETDILANSPTAYPVDDSEFVGETKALVNTKPQKSAKLDIPEPKGNEMGVIARISGEVEVLLPGETIPIKLSEGVENGTISLPYGLPEKAQIFTGDETLVRIGVGGGAVITIDALSEFTLDKFGVDRSRAQPDVTTRMRLKTGKVDVDIAKGAFTSDMKIATPVNTGAVTGTHFAVAYDEKTGISIFEIYDGTIEVTNDKTNKTISLASSYDKPIKRVEIGKDNKFVYKTAIAGNEWRKRQALWVFVAIGLTFVVIFGLYGKGLTKNRLSFMISLVKTNLNVGIIVVLVIGLLLGYIIYPFINRTARQTTQPQDTTTTTQSGWTTFKDEQSGISFDYPPSWSVSQVSQVFENGDLVAVQLLGPSQQENTEFYDGGRFIVMTPVPTDLDLDSWVNSKYTANDQISDVTINGVAFKKVYTCGLGCFTFYYTVANGKVYGVNTF
ncbi:MAG: FecR domain-containing protein, partial [Candidatus Levybacteria bacterium]|nr:FecR domain-containing protein [Candidatus Levybacteria bacterium]